MRSRAAGSAGVGVLDRQLVMSAFTSWNTGQQVGGSIGLAVLGTVA